MKELKYHTPEPEKVGGFYPESKVYFDGSHYIAIPHTTKPYKPRPKKREDIITVKPPAEPSEETIQEQESAPPIDDTLLPLEKIAVTGEIPKEEEPEQTTNILQPNERRMTKKELFNELYQEYLFLKKRERRGKLIEAMRPYFKTEKAAEKLTREMCYELLDRIVVGGMPKNEGEDRMIDIVYKVDISSVIRYKFQQ